MQSLKTKRLSGQSSSAQASSATELHNETLDMASPGPILIELTAGFWPYQISTPQERVEFGTNKF
jgi:hypothetical protein